MKTAETVSGIELQSLQVKCILAVLAEIEDYFSEQSEFEHLHHYAGQISLLLHVVSGLLNGMLPALEQIADGLAGEQQAEMDFQERRKERLWGMPLGEAK